MSQTNNNNEQTNRLSQGNGLSYGEQNRPTLLPYHEYMAMQRQNSVLQLPSSTALVNGNQSRGYSQSYYSSSKGGYNNSYYNNLSPNTSGYTLPPYSQYQRENHSHYYHYQQSYPNYYYNSQTPYYQSQSQLPNTTQYNTTLFTSPLKQTNQQQLQTKMKQQQSQIGNKQQNNNQLESISSEKKQKIYKQQQQQQVLNNSRKDNNNHNNHNNNSAINKQSYGENKYTNTNVKQQTKYQQDNYSSNDDWSQQQEQEEIIYQRYQNKKNNYYQQNKSKPINKKKDPVIDDPEEIKKWVQARKKNYPGLRKKALQQNSNNQLQKEQNSMMNISERQQMSKLEYKIRKKLLIVNGDSRSIMKKIKNIDILRRIIQDPKILKRERKNKNYQNIQKLQEKQQQQLINPIQQTKIIPQEEIEVVEERVKAMQTENIQQARLPLQFSSQSQDQVQPEQAPANKVPRQQQKSQENKKIIEQPKNFFEYIDKKQFHIIEPKEAAQQRRQGKGTLDPDTIIAHLKSKQEEDRESLNTLFDYKSNSHSYNYRVQTLQTSLKLDQIFAQTTYLLQAIRYIVKQNFFDQL